MDHVSSGPLSHICEPTDNCRLHSECHWLRSAHLQRKVLNSADGDRLHPECLELRSAQPLREDRTARFIVDEVRSNLLRHLCEPTRGQRIANLQHEGHDVLSDIEHVAGASLFLSFEVFSHHVAGEPVSVEEAISELGWCVERGMAWAVLHLRGPPSFSGLRLVRKLKDTPGNDSGLARAASGNPFARCAVRENFGFQLLEQESAVSFVSIELVSLAEEASRAGPTPLPWGAFGGFLSTLRLRPEIRKEHH